MRWLLPVLAAWLVAGCVSHPPTYQVVHGNEQPPRMGGGACCPGAEAAWAEVIGSQQAWLEYWAWNRPVGQGTPAPPLDFATDVVVHVQWDQRPSTGHAVRVDDVAWADGHYAVAVTLVSPGDGCGVGRAITNPFAAVVTGRAPVVEPRVELAVTLATEGCGGPAG